MRVITSTVTEPLVSTDMKDAGLKAAREGALDATADRLRLLLNCAIEVEQFCGRAFFRAASERISTAELVVDEPARPFPACSRLPDVTGVTLTLTSVERWDDDLLALVPAVYTVRPGGRLVVNEPGDYKVICRLLPDTKPPTEALEAMARLFALREVNRPGDATENIGDQPSLSNAMVRSGASEIVRHIRRVSAA